MKLKLIIYLFLFSPAAIQCYSQTKNSAGSINKYKTVAAGEEYKKSAWHRFVWGNNYRDVWTTPVTVPVIWLDTLKGGIKSFKEGGGHQTTSLHVQTKEGKEYAFRSIDKTLVAVLPKNYKGTFMEKLVNDEVSMSNPYGALIVPVLAESAHIYHTNPQLVYLPAQPLLDTLNEKYGNKFYLFEQKAEGDWSNAENLGNFDDFFSTEDVRKKMLDNNKYQIDQAAFVKARIFDWFIGDWDRHEDQWDWGEKKTGDTILFIPVPEDRDQAFSKYDGLLLGPALSAAGLSYIQSFEDNIKSIKKFNYEERYLDRFFTNEITLQNWQSIATDLQQSFTDDVITKAVKQLPTDVFNISGDEIIAKLKARRSHLEEWATAYYKFINEQVQVAASDKDEHFKVEHINNDETLVQVYDLNDKHETKDSAFYSRIFNAGETKEVRLFGINGNDVYHITGKRSNLKLRTIGGAQPDSFVNESAGKVYIYDDKNGNFINKNKSNKLRLSNDTSVHDFDYTWFKYNKSGVKPSIFYSYEDRIYVGLGYQFIHNAWRKEPFASKQLFDIHYSLSQKAFSYTYSALFPKLIGKADVSLFANYDAIRWIRFWGLGNETKFVPKTISQFTTRSRQWIFQPTIIRNLGLHKITGSVFAQGVEVIDDTSKFIHSYITNPQVYKWKTFAGADLNYTFQKLNDSIVPMKGFIFFADARAAHNIKEANSYYVKYSGNMQVYVPLFSNFSYVFRAGAATITGKPEFYQYASIGGAPNLRGFRRDRYWGKTTFWNTHDVRFIAPVKSYLYNGKAGLIAFFDNGRVWMPCENSNTWHTDVGAGVTLAPFNKILAYITYGFSSDGHIIQVRINKYF